MAPQDFIRLTFGALTAHRMRTILAALGIAVGIASVILLTSIGQGLHDFVLSEFSSFGTNLLIVTPGKVATGGISIGVFGTVRPLTIDDAIAVRRVKGIVATNPSTDGNAEVSANGRHRRVNVYGMTADWLTITKMRVRTGSFLPRDDVNTPRPLAVLGSKAKVEMFGNANPLGKQIDVGGMRFHVIGVMESQGQFVGMDLDDSVLIPTARAIDLFNREGCTAFHASFAPGADVGEVTRGIRRVIAARHGRDDVTIITQDQMIEVLGSVLGVLTFAVGALGSISLLVGGVGILTIMTIAVSERTSEIGLLRAIGTTQQQIVLLFLGEAALLAAVGGAAGFALGVLIAQALTAVFPALPVSTPWWFAVLAESIAITVGLAAGVIPARHAAGLDPVDALRAG
jgi:putative ABC transport system permease protein